MAGTDEMLFSIRESMRVRAQNQARGATDMQLAVDGQIIAEKFRELDTQLTEGSPLPIDWRPATIIKED